MTISETDIQRGKALQKMTNREFYELWQKYKSYTPNELNAVEPFFLIVAMEKFGAMVNGMKM